MDVFQILARSVIPKACFQIPKSGILDSTTKTLKSALQTSDYLLECEIANAALDVFG